MQARHQTIIDLLLQNAFEERIYESLFSDVLEQMSPAEHAEIAPYLVERWPVIADRVAAPPLPVPSLQDAERFVFNRLHPDSQDIDAAELDALCAEVTDPRELNTLCVELNTLCAELNSLCNKLDADDDDPDFAEMELAALRQEDFGEMELAALRQEDFAEMELAALRQESDLT